MNTALIYNTIKETVQFCLPGSRVLLFGSRARGEQDIHSDYDLLIVTPKTLTPQEKIEWSTRIDCAIVKATVAWPHHSFCYEGGNDIITPALRNYIDSFGAIPAPS